MEEAWRLENERVGECNFLLVGREWDFVGLHRHDAMPGPAGASQEPSNRPPLFDCLKVNLVRSLLSSAQHYGVQYVQYLQCSQPCV